jgi:putative hydrolase of the HAD superfamily
VAIIFDWAGTLTPWREIDVLGTWRSVATKIDPSRAEHLGDTLYAAERELLGKCLIEHSSTTLEQVFADARIPLEQAVLDAYFAAWTPYTYIDSEGPGVLSGLRDRGIKVGVLSNTLWSRARHEMIFERDNVLGLIDAAVYSSEIPWVKPHPEAFKAALEAVGVEDADSCVFVGDRLFEDIYGAGSLGMRTVYIPHSNLPEHEIGHTEGEPDAVIHSLADLLPLIDSWNM